MQGNPETWRNIAKTYVTVAEAAPSLGLTEKALRQRIFRGQVPYRKLGQRVLIPADELEKFLAVLPGTTTAEAVAAVASQIGSIRLSEAAIAPLILLSTGYGVQP